jgi:hypothetical protein
MKDTLLAGTMFLLLLCAVIQLPASYDLHFSTYAGGVNMDQMRDIDVDSYGNIYITGGTESTDFPVTPGAYDTTHNGWFDVFVMKFDPDGNLLWSTFVGGANYDRAYSIKVVDQGDVICTGRGGPGFPVTPGVFQTQFLGYYNGIYGDQNAFIFKLAASGSTLVWASYFGVSTLIRDCDIDANGDVYVTSGYVPGQSPDSLPPSWVANGFQPNTQGGMDGVVAKIKGDGTQVLWATYLGGSGDEGVEASIRIDPLDQPCILQFTQSTDMPFSPHAYDSTHNGGWDFFVTKLSSDGSNLIFGTYIGGSQHEFISTHNIGVDNYGNAYVLAPTQSSDYPTTPGAFQETYGGGSSDLAVSKISSDGTQLLISTFVSGNGSDNGEGISVDSTDTVYFGGDTYSTNYPFTADAYQNYNAGGQDGILVKLKADFTDLLYATYFGGSSDDGSRCSVLDDSGSFYYGGWTQSDDFPLKNPWQDSLVGGWDLGLAKFSPLTGVQEEPNQHQKPSLTVKTSNPTRSISIAYSIPSAGPVTIQLFDCTGRMVEHCSFHAGAGTHTMSIETGNVSGGIYFLKFQTQTCTRTEKFILF